MSCGRARIVPSENAGKAAFKLSSFLLKDCKTRHSSQMHPHCEILSLSVMVRCARYRDARHDFGYNLVIGDGEYRIFRAGRCLREFDNCAKSTVPNVVLNRAFVESKPSGS